MVKLPKASRIDMDDNFTLQDHNIQENLWKLFQSDALTDVTIVVLQGKFYVFSSVWVNFDLFVDEQMEPRSA